jgi:hypothetical protein
MFVKVKTTPRVKVTAVRMKGLNQRGSRGELFFTAFHQLDANHLRQFSFLNPLRIEGRRRYPRALLHIWFNDVELFLLRSSGSARISSTAAVTRTIFLWAVRS